MTDAEVQVWVDKVKRTNGVIPSFIQFHQDEVVRLNAVIEAMRATGVSETQLAPLLAEVETQVGLADAMAAAIAANP